MTIHQQNKIELRERLLDAQTTDSALRAEYERKVNAMFEKRLSAGKKIWFVTLMLFSLATIVAVTSLLLTENLPGRAQIALIAGIGFAAAWIVYLIRVLRRGVMLRRVDPPLAAGMGFIFALAMCLLLALGGAKTDAVLLMSVLTVIPAGLILLLAMIKQSELSTQVRLVELQYELRILAKRFDDDSASGSGVLR